MKIRVAGGRIIDPSLKIDRVGDLFISDGVIVEQTLEPAEFKTIKANGLWVVPGLIDAHVHLREPGQEHKEDMESGLLAAANGGFTAVLPMPNTEPANSTVEITRAMIERAERLGGARVHPVAAVTKGRKGKELAPLADLKKAGAVAFSDDGSAVVNDDLMREALLSCRKLNVPLCQHAEDPALSAGGVVHQGDVSRELGVPGWPAEAEDRVVARDIALAEETGAHLHVSHVSTKGTVELVRDAKRRGLKVTCEVTPHHLLLTDDIAPRIGTIAKVNPPLRPKEHRDALVEALADGTIDIVATDHAPHTVEDKSEDWLQSSFGMVGLEISLPLMLKLVDEGTITPMRMVEVMSSSVAEVFSIQGGTLSEGFPADVTIINPDSSFSIDPESFKSKGRNTPFSEWIVPGKAAYTIVGGRIVFRND